MQGHHLPSVVNPTEIIDHYLSLETDPAALTEFIQTLPIETVKLHCRIISDHLKKLEKIRDDGGNHLVHYRHTMTTRDLCSHYRSGNYTDTTQLTWAHKGYTFSANGVTPPLPVDFLEKLKYSLYLRKLELKKVTRLVTDLALSEAALRKKQLTESSSSGSLDEEVKLHVEDPEEIKRKITAAQTTTALEVLEGYDDLVKKNKTLEFEIKNQAERLDEALSQNLRLLKDLELLKLQAANSKQDHEDMEATIASLKSTFADAEKINEELQAQLSEAQKEINRLTPVANEGKVQDSNTDQDFEVPFEKLNSLLLQYKPSVITVFGKKEVVFDSFYRLCELHKNNEPVKMSEVKRLIAHDNELMTILNDPKMHLTSKRAISAVIRGLGEAYQEKKLIAQVAALPG